jgi:hypothetical protein
MEFPGATKSSTAIRKTVAPERPSIDVAHVDDAVDCHLISKIDDLWPRFAKGEEEDVAESLRSNLRVAIAEVLISHGVKVVKP